VLEYFITKHTIGHVVAQAVRCRLFTVEALVSSQGSVCGICGGQTGTVAGFSHRPLVFSCHYHSITASCMPMYHVGWTVDSFVAALAQRQSYPAIRIRNTE
jgi:hypothetical protein